jgi:hypothetical protein
MREREREREKPEKCQVEFGCSGTPEAEKRRFDCQKA